MWEIGTRAGNGGNLGRKWVAGTGGPRRRSFCRRWRSHSGWVLARDGERQWPFEVVLGTKKIGYREEDVLHWFRMVAGTGRRPEMEDSWNWKNDGIGRNWKNDGVGRIWRTTVVGRAWRTAVAGRPWWSTVGRKWVDGERKGKIWGEALK
jgi:hypothetical protein